MAWIILYGFKLKSLIARAEALSPEDKARPAPEVAVFYIGIPRKFIAGEVYSPTEDKCLDGAEVTLVDITTGGKFTTRTDNYGDFWLEGLEIGTYSLTIEKDGYYPKEIKSISTEKDVNLGDIRIYKRR